MYAVIKTGGKQYRVTSGDVIKIEKIVVKRVIIESVRKQII